MRELIVFKSLGFVTRGCSFTRLLTCTQSVCHCRHFRQNSVFPLSIGVQRSFANFVHPFRMTMKEQTIYSSSSLLKWGSPNACFVILRNSSSSGDATTSSVDKNYAIKDKKKKTIAPVKIMLISETNSVTMVTLDEATKMAHKRGFHLKEVDNKDGKIKTEKQVFKLAKLTEDDQDVVEKVKVVKVKGTKVDRNVPNTESANKEKTSQSHSHKEVKTLIVLDKIAENDLLSKINNVAKWIKKGHRVNVFINSNASGKGDAETVFQTIENNVKEFGRVHNKQKKGKDIRFHIEPPPPSNVKSTTTSSASSTTTEPQKSSETT